MQKINALVENYVNRITMYYLLLSGLKLLFLISWIFSCVGILPYGIMRPLYSIWILFFASYVASYVFARLYKVDASTESSIITALILYFIFQPPQSATDGIALALAGIIAIASKYIVTYRQRHLFNPAAFGAFAIGMTGLLSSRWWIGSDSMFIFVFVVGVLIVKKIRRVPMIVAFIVPAIVLAVARNDQSIVIALRDTILSFPIVFFATIMLTEPITTPPKKQLQIIYGLFMGILFSSGLRFGDRTMTPEHALLLGNVVAFAMASRIRQPLRLQRVREISTTIYEYTFEPIVPVQFQAGQYAELTIPIVKPDARGNRRSFTIASSPTEKNIIFAVKQSTPSSSFKTALASLQKNTEVSVNTIAGDFTLPDDPNEQLVCIAGGIGVTPFRSMVQYLIDTKQTRSITLFYTVRAADELVYTDVFAKAKAQGLKVVYVLDVATNDAVPKNWNGEVGRIDYRMIAKHVSNYKSRTFYISGPNAMVLAIKTMLTNHNIPKRRIRTDYFSGY